MHAAAEPNGQVIVLLTLRSDFFGATAEFPEMNRAIATGHEIAPVMSQGELRAAIAEPARVAGRPLAGAAASRMLGEVEGRDSSLPLLQFALHRIGKGFGRHGAKTTVWMRCRVWVAPSHSGQRNCSKRWTNEAAGWFVGLSRRWCSLGKVSVTRAGVSGSVTWFRVALPRLIFQKPWSRLWRNGWSRKAAMKRGRSPPNLRMRR